MGLWRRGGHRPPAKAKLPAHRRPCRMYRTGRAPIGRPYGGSGKQAAQIGPSRRGGHRPPAKAKLPVRRRPCRMHRTGRAPIGRPSCPVHSAWPSVGGQFCFRRAADGRPYEKAQSVRLASRSTVGAPNGRPLCPVHSAQFFRRPAILLRRAAGGRPYAVDFSVLIQYYNSAADGKPSAAFFTA